MAQANGSGPAVALVGNPNVGKSTVFNALTNLHQHTGNFNYGELLQQKNNPLSL